MTRMKKHLRVISMLMVVVMVLASMPSSIFAVDNTTNQVDQLSYTSSEIPSDTLVSTNSIDEDITVINEVIELRTETAKHFRMSDGSFVLVEYNDPVHYLDDNNYYQDIDNTLAQNEDGTYGNTFNDISFQFAENSNSDAIVTIENEGNTITISALETNEDKIAEVVNPETIELSEEKIEDVSVLNEISASVTYPEIFEKTDLEYVVEGKSLKENIIVKEAKEEYVYSFALHIDGLAAQLNEDGSISVCSADNVVYSIPAPFMYDAEGEISNDVYFDLVQNDGSYTLVVTADTEWMNSEGRVFPVTIDPTVTTDNDGDTNMNRITTRYYVEGDSADRASNNEGYIYNGYAKQASSTNRGDSSSYIKINTLPTLPEYSVITNATINLYQNGFTGNELNEVELAMSEVSDETNWYTETSTDYVGLNTVSSATANKYLSWNITNLVKDWYEDYDTNHGFRITNNTAMTSDCYATIPFVAYNSINTDNLPKLIINYISSVGIEDYYSYDSQNIDRAGTAYVKLDDGSLSVIKNDLTAIGDHVDFELNHTYNSALSTSDYMTSRFPGMKFGYGWMINVQEFAEKARLTNDSGNLAYYYIYTDGDGTVHYLYYDSGAEEYRDIDGLGLSLTYYINSNGAEIATLFTAKGETKTFVEGYLSTIVDSKGNIFTFKYTTTTANKLGSKFTPSINRSRLLSVTQKLWNEADGVYSAEKTIATLAYNSDGYLASIIDGRGYTTTYTYSNNLLSSVTHNDSKAVKYLYNNNSKLTVAFDDETNQGIKYTINSKGMVSAINEFAYMGTDLSYTDEYSYGKCLGLEANTSEGVTYLRDYGTNANNDDIVYHYVFDNSGRCVTSYSANKKTTDTADAFKIYGTELIQYTDYTSSSPNTANDITSIIRAGSIAQNLAQKRWCRKFP